MITNLTSVQVDYGYEAAVFNQVVASEILTPFDVNNLNDNVHGAVNLNLNSSGNIEFFVSGNTGNVLRLREHNTSLLQMSTTNSNQFKIESGIGSSNEFYFNDFATYSVTEHAYIDVGDRALHLIGSELLFDTSIQVGGDLKVHGNTFTQNLHITRNFNDNEVTYAFIINDDNTLDLIKRNSNNDTTNRVASFGKGEINDNMLYSLCNYNTDNSAVPYESTNTTGGWRLSGQNNNITWGWRDGEGWINSEKIGIGTKSPQEKLHVAGTILVTDPISQWSQSTSSLYISSSTISGLEGLQFKDGLSIDSDNISGVKVIRFNNFRMREDENDSLIFERYNSSTAAWESVGNFTPSSSSS